MGYNGQTNLGMELHENIRDSSSRSTGYSISWANLGYTVSQGNCEKEILSRLHGILHPGSMVAILGASGAGKSTFLDVLAGRKAVECVTGIIAINGRTTIPMKHVSRYCPQDDALYGNLTVWETLMYAADFNLPKSTPRKEKVKIVNELLKEFGLVGCKDTIIGTPLRKGCSGGQVRRVSAASQIIGFKEGILFLDEPTSGLDSVAAYSIIAGVSSLVKKQNLVALTTIHQPSTETFNLFTHLLLLGKGRTVYLGRREEAPAYFESIGHPIPMHSNPSDVYLQLTNADFDVVNEDGKGRIFELVTAFANSDAQKAMMDDIKNSRSNPVPYNKDNLGYRNTFGYQTSILFSRAFLNALKNPLAFWVRVVMYIALAGLMGSVWIRLGTEQSTVADRLSGLCFAAAFLTFMAIAGTPSFLEERLVVRREIANGLYGVPAYALSNFLVAIPFLFLITLSFTFVAYFAIGFQETSEKLITFAAVIFFSLVIAEAQTILVAVLLPVFVGALTISSFLNGLWLIVQGFFVQKKNLPRFWFYSFHQINPSKYIFELLVGNELKGLTFSCNVTQPVVGCACMFPSMDRNNTCQFTGNDVLKYYEIDDVSVSTHFLILAAILIVIKLVTVSILILQTTNRNKGKQWDPERSVMKAIMAPKLREMSAMQSKSPTGYSH